jgi:predicted RecB family nuclease
MVTNDTFVNFLHCKRKAFLLATGIDGQPTDIETVLLDRGRVYRRRAMETLLARCCVHDVVLDPPCLEAALKGKPQFIVNASVSADGVSSNIDALERLHRASHRSSNIYAPVLFTPNETVSRFDKLLLGFNALALSFVQRGLPPFGKIIHGTNCTLTKCTLKPLMGDVRKLVAQIQAVETESVAPRVTLNRHCICCEYQGECRQLAKEADDLSLLRGLPDREIERQRRRGVTTVTQFGYTYRPGRRGKLKTGAARRHDHALQAVAIREQKIYVMDSPTIPTAFAALYLDVEGVPDQGFDYLIGLLVVVDGRSTTYSFWADDRTQE